MRGFVIARRNYICHTNQNDKTPKEGNSRAHGHKRVHIGRGMNHAPHTADKKLFVDPHDNKGQNHFHNGYGKRIIEEGRHREIPHQMAHGDVHQGEQKTYGCNQTIANISGHHIGLIVFGFGLSGSKLLTLPRIALSKQGRFIGKSAVSGLFDGTDDFLGSGASFYGHGIGQKINADFFHIGQFFDGIFDSRGTGRAAHAGNTIFIH